MIKESPRYDNKNNAESIRTPSNLSKRINVLNKYREFNAESNVLRWQHGYRLK